MSELANAENSANQTPQTNAPAPIVIKVSEILADLQSGLTREQIRVRLGLTKSQLVEVFKNPKLKGRKTRVILSGFVLEDDTETPEVESAPVAPAQRTPRASRAAVNEVASATEEPAAIPVEETVTAEPVAETTTEIVETPEVEELKEEDEKSPWDR